MYNLHTYIDVATNVLIEAKTRLSGAFVAVSCSFFLSFDFFFSLELVIPSLFKTFSAARVAALAFGALSTRTSR